MAGPGGQDGPAGHGPGPGRAGQAAQTGAPTPDGSGPGSPSPAGQRLDPTLFRLYHCLDAVYAHKEAIEDHLAQRGQELLGRDYSFLLYDLSSTYFEGQAEKNPKAKRGYSRDHRQDAKQVCAGFVTDRNGYGVGMETWRGNIKDHETLSSALDQLEARFGPPHDPHQPDKPRPLVVMDRGMTTDKTVPEPRPS